MANEKLTTASVTFEYGNDKSGTAISNSTDFISAESIILEKSCLSESYFLGDKITYIIDIKNNSDVPMFNIKIKEDMAKQKSADDTNSHSPLKYANAFKCYINGNVAEITDPKIYSDKIIFEIDVLPALSCGTIIYSAEITENAPLKTKSSITNTSSLIIPSTGKTLTSSHTINVKEIADIKTIKQIKNSFGGGIAYSISIYNYGNMPAKNVVIKDKIESTSSNFNIKIGSKNVSSSDYALTSNYLQIPSYTSKYSISVPEAQFIKDDTSGKFGIIPGTTEINIDYKV